MHLLDYDPSLIQSPLHPLRTGRDLSARLAKTKSAGLAETESVGLVALERENLNCGEGTWLTYCESLRDMGVSCCLPLGEAKGFFGRRAHRLGGIPSVENDTREVDASAKKMKVLVSKEVPDKDVAPKKVTPWRLLVGRGAIGGRISSFLGPVPSIVEGEDCRFLCHQWMPYGAIAAVVRSDGATALN
ncbi:hypothetical protein GW17_00007724 [Ensete ventricosum]|nr:hypothetical protein GW17_00007724 [Ensete ventricosum]